MQLGRELIMYHGERLRFFLDGDIYFYTYAQINLCLIQEKILLCSQHLKSNI